MVVFIIRRIIKRSVILWVRRRKTAFPTPAHQSMTARNAATACVQPAIELDPSAFVNIIKTDYINGRFYHKTDY